MESHGEWSLAEGTLDGIRWALVVSSQGGRLVVGPDHRIVGSVDTRRTTLGFGPISVGYVPLLAGRRVVIQGTTIPALRDIRMQDHTGTEIEVAVAYAKKDLGCNVFLAFPLRKPVKVVGTVLTGSGAFVSLQSVARGFIFPGD
jgi:hypothetical protein